MAGSLNKVILIGNVGKDPEIRNSQDGREIANLVLATTESWRDKNSGERKEKTEWHKVVIFSEGLVRIIKEYVKKGMKIYVEGSLQTRKWTDQQGLERYTTEIVIQGFNGTITMLDSNKSTDSSHSSDTSSNNTASNYTNQSYEESDLLDDEIPF